MTPHPMVPERVAVQRERQAFLAGVNWQYSDLEHEREKCPTSQLLNCLRHDDARAVAAKRYPLPKIDRPRVVSESTDYGTTEWRFVDGELEWRRPASARLEWNSLGAAGCGGMYITASRAVLLADLVAHPTELVEDSSGPIPEAVRP